MPLTRAERGRRTAELLTRAHAANDEAERQALLAEVVVINRPVADAIARRYQGRGVNTDDLQQAAYEGLVRAVYNFDPSVRPDLLTYAVPTIRGQVQRWFRDCGWTVRPPRRLQELQWRLQRTQSELTQELGREPRRQELCDRLECASEELREAENAFGLFTVASLDRTFEEGKDGAAATLAADTHRDDDAAEARVMLAPILKHLPERDRRILYMRFIEERSQKDIGRELGVTQMQVSRLLTRILRNLRRQLEPAAA